MNLFDNIIKQSASNFLGIQPTPTVPSFMQPQAPRTTNYTQPVQPTAPVVQKPSMTLFSDEQKMFQRMKADNLSDDQSYGMLKKRRTDLLGGDGISADETKMLLRMQADNIPVKQAVAMIQKRRQDMAEKANSIHDLHADEGVVEQTLKAPFRAIGDVASQTWQGIGKGTEGLLNASFRGVNDLNKMIGSSDYSPELEKQLPQGGYLGDVAKIGAGTTGAVFNLGKAPLALGINTANQLPGAQYITQGIGKGIQYGAEQLGGLAGVDKETSMDLATTGMNLFGMKPGMNTLQYGRGIVNAPGVMGKAGAIVKPVGESVVQTVKMPYDIAKGTYNLAKKLPNPLPKGADVSTRANRFNAGDEGKFIEQIKETPGQFATSRGMTEVGEKAIEKAQQNFERSKLEADTSFDAIQGKFSTKGSNNDIVGDILKANKEKMDAQPRNKDRVRVDELFAKYESNEGLSMSEINEAKRIHARNHTYSYEQRTSNEARNASDIQNDIRDWQFQTAKENGFTNADKVNMETKGWKMFADSLAKKMDRSGANNAIGITDWIALSGGNPTNVALFLGKKAASSNLVKTGAIKLLSKQTKPSIIKGTKADIQQANFEKNVNRGISSDRNSVGGDSMVTPAGLIEAPTGQATGAKNFRVNQPAEKPPIKNEGQVGVRPGSKSQAQIKEEVQLAKQATRQSELKLITDDIASATERARYGGTGNTRIETQLNGKMDAGKLTREEAIDIATEILQDVQKKGISSKYKYIDRPKLEEYINDLYSNKKMPTFDDLLNESKPIVKPNTIKNESKVNKPVSSDTIPEGYFKNSFGEIQKNPSNSKGGFIRNPFAKPEPKRLFAGENSAQPPKSKTGWFKGADGKMRFEIDDSGAKISFPIMDRSEITKQFLKSKFPEKYGKIPNFRLEESLSIKDLRTLELLKDNSNKTTFKIGDILQHDELFKQYPELKDMDVMLNTKYGRKDGAMEGGTMMLGEISNSDSLKGLILHEIQHSIQEKEGFARGGSANESSLKAAEKYWYNTDKTFKEIADIYNKINQDHIEGRITGAERMMKRMSLEQKFEKEIKDFTIGEYEAYKRLAGEVEARNVQTRMNMTRAERTKTSPIVTEEKDVPRAKQIIRMDSKGPSLLKIPEIGKKVEGIKVYKGVNGEGTGKKFPLDYFTTDKKSASQYGKEVIETTIYPKKIADFTNPSNRTELRKILRDNLNPKLADEFIDRAMEGKDSFSNPLYEMVENPKVTQALKDAGYDATKYLDYGNKNSKFARHETIAMLDVKPINKSIPVKNPLVEEARKTRFIEDSKKALQKWSPRKGGYEIKNIKLEDTNVYPAKSRYDTPVYKQYDQYKKSDSVEYWMKRIKEGDTPPPVVVEKRGDKFYVWDGHHRMVAAEESGLKNIDAIVIEKPLEKGNDKKFISFSEKGIENLTKKLEDFYKSKTIK